MAVNHSHPLLDSEPMIVAPGIADTLGALAAQRAGFRAVFLSGSAVAQVHLGRPDIGLTDASILVDITRRITERVSIPVCVDIDTGFGNAFNVHQTVSSMAMAGAACVQMEDQVTVKPLDDVQRRPVISLTDMQVKIRAALDARADSGLLISARTDARYDEGLASALERAQAYAECGADLVFVEGLTDSAERAQLKDLLGPNVPRVLNTGILKMPPGQALALANDEGYRIALGPTWVTASVVQAMTGELDTIAAACPADSVNPVHSAGQTNVASLIQADDFIHQSTNWKTPHE
ncbi:MAG: oxaloacetate decarboxylase [Lysobacterales bacterium]